ncbi:MAG: Phosphoribosylformylglycinamidine cyclo-ligase [Parcubacteria group bacterium Gr01-1014_29]|nr:MAG: Phosphoribosylformylglycinamidine cyclo-ligase [Parcubacteria group bacterium Gr01-1014_29]
MAPIRKLFVCPLGIIFFPTNLNRALHGLFVIIPRKGEFRGMDGEMTNRCETWYGRRSTFSMFYDELLVSMNGWFSENYQPIVKMHAIIHLTGGSFEGKFARDILFPRGLSAELTNLWDPPEVMKECKEWRGMTDEECHTIWSCGQGMLVVVDSDGVAKVKFIALAKEFGIEARVCGLITKNKPGKAPTLEILSRFTGNTILFNAHGSQNTA